MHLSFTLSTLLVALGLFVGMLLCFALGKRLGNTWLARESEALATGAGPVEAAIFGLLGLLLALTFSGAASRFAERRQLIAEEANEIGTAYARVGLLPDDTQPALRKLFRDYVDARASVYRDAADTAAVETKLREAAGLQERLWAEAVAACRRPEAPASAAMLLLPALNTMMDMTTTRAVAMQNHPPKIIYILLCGLSLLSSLLVGCTLGGSDARRWFYMLLLATTLSVTLYVILDLEYPRFGLIRIDAADQILTQLQTSLR